MSEWWKNFLPLILNPIMKKTDTASEMPTATANAEKSATNKAAKKTPETSVAAKKTKTKPETSVASKAIKSKPETSVTPEAPPKATPKKTSPKHKPAKKTPVADAEPITPPPEIAMHERIGLTAGSIWHFLAENGAASVAKLVAALPEEEEIIQRSIGWLAQEGKITISVVDQVETIALKG